MKGREGLSPAVEETAAMAGNDRTNVYQDITDSIIADLERGCVPWAQPWDSKAATAPFTIPRNASTRRQYSGINILTLWAAVTKRKFTGHSWLTFRQALAAGGCVRKGEHGVTVVYADRFTPDAERQRARETGDVAASIPFVKRFTLFNADQCEGLPADPAAALPPPEAIVPAADAVIAATGAVIRVGGGEAFYHPGLDYVQVPPVHAYFEPINWFRTVFHELGHHTGHASRLNRDQSGVFGSSAYAREELVAEMAGAFVCATLGVTPTVRHADYLDSWLEVLRADNRAIVRAASAASKAADHILQRRQAEAQSEAA
jgi:antirestriction protein ArdC